MDYRTIFTVFALLGGCTAPATDGPEHSASEESSGSTTLDDGGSSDSSDSGTAESTSTGAQPRPPGCECIVDEEPGGSLPAPMAPTCGEFLCDRVEITGCYDYCEEGEQEAVENPEAMQCALEALRDRTPGIVTWRFNEAIRIENGYILINEDGSAVRRSWGPDDLLFQASAAVLGELETAEDYTDCMAVDNARDQYRCLAGLSEIGATCDEGWSGEKL